MNSPVTPVTLIHNTGILLQLLNRTKEIGFNELQSKAEMDDMNFYMAIGYLVKENKVILIPGESGMRINLA